MVSAAGLLLITAAPLVPLKSGHSNLRHKKNLLNRSGAIKSGINGRTFTYNGGTSRAAQSGNSKLRHKKTPTNLVGAIKSSISGRTFTYNSGTHVPLKSGNSKLRHKKTPAKSSRGYKKWYQRPDLNRHALRQGILNPPCIPISSRWHHFSLTF